MIVVQIEKSGTASTSGFIVFKTQYVEVEGFVSVKLHFLKQLHFIKKISDISIRKGRYCRDREFLIYGLVNTTAGSSGLTNTSSSVSNKTLLSVCTIYLSPPHFTW